MTELSKKSLILRKIIRKSLYCFRFIQYKIMGIGKKVDDKLIIFACYGGKSYVCSPKAIYEYMQSSEEYKDYTFVWAFKEIEKYKELENNKNTILVKIGSKKYKKYMLQSKYWVFNYKIAEYLYPKKNQVFLQCWHGTPLKRLGCDLLHYDNQLNTVKDMKKRYKIEAKKFSYFISPSKFASEKFISAWNLKEIGKDNIILEEGYPRNDYLYNYKPHDVQEIKERLGIANTNKKIVLYAPTYRSNQHQSGVGYVFKSDVDFDKLQKELGEEIIILYRPHYFIANQFDFAKYEGFIYDVSNVDDINDLYIVSDILVTDYSSVFFDYANLKRPMIFHMYDLEHYRDESNGFYLDVEEELPGKITRTDEDLIAEIKNVSNNFVYNDKYKRFNETYNYLDDGNASKRVVKKVVENDRMIKKGK